MPRRIPPRRKRCSRSSNRAIDVRFAGDLDAVGNERVIDGAVDRQSLAGGGRDVFAVDEEVGLNRGSHGCWFMGSLVVACLWIVVLVMDGDG